MSVSLQDLIHLAGIRSSYQNSVTPASEGSNISITAKQKADLQQQHNIEPGTAEWFQLWFSLPYLTGEKPIGFRSRRK